MPGFRLLLICIFTLVLADASPAGGVDLDQDGVNDVSDNCLNIANQNQRDTDMDGFGNACDPDLNNDGIVNPADLSVIRFFFGAPGPSGSLAGPITPRHNRAVR